jgi:hypothetical protein
MAAHETVEVELSPEDRVLILQYGYPFPQIENAIRSMHGTSPVETGSLDRFYLEKLIGDLCISIKETDDEGLQHRLDDLCERLEFSVRGGYTVI